MAARGHYLQRTQIAIVFLAFALVAVPLSYVQLASPFPPLVAGWLMIGYVVLLGNTHFAITWALYLNSANVRHFGSSPGRRIVYFVLPLLVLSIFCVIGVLQLPPEGTRLLLWFTIAVAAADYFHVLRQSFGVLQMFKARAGAGFSRALARVDNAYFLSLLALQLITFVNGIDQGFKGRFDASTLPTQIALCVAGVLLVAVLTGLLSAWRRNGVDRRALVTALGYLLLQSASASLAIYRSRLYLPSLAMHYVEYHVLMAPRLFSTPLDLSSRLDRVSAALRRHKLVFYVALVAVAACASGGALLALGGMRITSEDARFGWIFVNLLNGIFVAHYLIEAFVWKFGHPFYRETLAPIYFPPRERGAATSRTSRPRERS